MRSKLFYVAILLMTFGVFGMAQPTYASEHQLYTIDGFVELLIERGFITEQNHTKARELASIISTLEASKAKAATVQNAEYVEVSLSQYIEYSKLAFAAGEDIQGLLLLVKNAGDTTTSLEAKRDCQVIYTIYSEEKELLYSSGESETCQTNERVTYFLDAGETRMFEITHKQNTYPLKKGTYTFQLEYPGYGKGQRTVTVY